MLGDEAFAREEIDECREQEGGKYELGGEEVGCTGDEEGDVEGLRVGEEEGEEGEPDGKPEPGEEGGIGLKVGTGGIGCR